MISIVDEAYFDIMGISLVEGRGFDGSEQAEEAFVGVVNQAFVDEVLGGASPVGATIRSRSRTEPVPGDASSGPDGAAHPETTIIGVAGDVRHQGLQVSPEPKLYVPFSQNDRPADRWVLRGAG